MPYRNSKLTRILQESIGGNSLTTLIIACSMCSYNEKETLSTLQFGQRAKCIKNKVTANIERSAKELERLLEIAEMKIKEYEHIITHMSGDQKHMATLARSVTQERVVETQVKDEALAKPLEVAGPTEQVSHDSYTSPKPKKKKCYTIGTQTDPLPDLSKSPKKAKKPVEHEEMDMIDDMNSEEEMAYLQKMEEEAMKKLEEEETRIKAQREDAKSKANKSNHLIQEIDSDYEGTPDPSRNSHRLFPSSGGSQEKLPKNTSQKSQEEIEKKAEPKGSSEAAYIAQTLQLVDKNLELKKLKDEKQALEEELEIKRLDSEEMRDKLFENSQALKDFQLSCRAFAQQMKICTEAAMLEYQEKASRFLQLRRELDDLNLKLIYVANDTDLQDLTSRESSDTGSAEGLSELSKLWLHRIGDRER